MLLLPLFIRSLRHAADCRCCRRRFIYAAASILMLFSMLRAAAVAMLLLKMILPYFRHAADYEPPSLLFSRSVFRAALRAALMLPLPLMPLRLLLRRRDAADDASARQRYSRIMLMPFHDTLHFVAEIRDASPLMPACFRQRLQRAMLC